MPAPPPPASRAIAGRSPEFALPPDPFENPWEHVRLYSDAARNNAMIDLVTRHAAGKRVLEVGCGSGLLSCIAARAGATKVYAIEPTHMVQVAQELVRRNGLDGIVEVHRGYVQELEPRPVDFAFSELLHANPFNEGVVDASNEMARWVVPGGRLAPSRLKVHAALVPAAGPSNARVRAEAELAAHATRWNLDLSPVSRVLGGDEGYAYNTDDEHPVGPAVVVYDIALGDGRHIPEAVERTLEVDAPATVGGVMVWFEAQLDETAVLANPPQGAGHWGHLVLALPRSRTVNPGERLRIRFDVEGTEMVAMEIGG